ncbi:hypothetical protein GQ57_08250 [Burkholderia sp. MSh2]|uniref:TetR family transcriptional regulator n=1 Tax=Burkholderia paludis TaxID=1506587 RepID=A0A6P2QB14_9BURK|nr:MULTISPECIES: TetR/AcrR family transcriptional regulator [Burkholderia]KEZ06359.1 hypothetical protein GQ57_08250 [Burkholderia sp. MSh2]KFG97727.1 hypothetical protein GQ56_0107440 [Burkholderia paludis]CAB3769818.1 hypothetical protein LMG30113_06073 [Burkholderia paludis]VWC17102.1 TetR family transcriptional regulator [Burkholderia paludis]
MEPKSTNPDDIRADPASPRRSESPSDTKATDGARTLTRRGRNTVGRILESAIEIFLVDGYGGLTMRKVAAGAGIALSNLQHYFPAREDLYAAIIAESIAEYSKTYDSVRTDDALSPEARLEKVVRLLIEDAKLPRTQSLFVNFWALAHAHEFARQAMEDAYLFQRQMIAGFVAAINPGLSPLHLARRSALITAQIEGLSVFIPQRNRFPSDIKGMEDEVVKAVLAVAALPG